jgi:hydroxymethylglutaryl-CoA reductase
MVIEESSVVAAAASAAKFWSNRGGFHCTVQSTIKKGQVHFTWKGEPSRIVVFFKKNKGKLREGLSAVTSAMEKRGGGIIDIELVPKPEIFNDYYQLDVSFETVDSMGANFINTCLETLATQWRQLISLHREFSDTEKKCDIIMAILSNYTPECIVDCKVKCPVDKLENISGNNLPGKEFSERFIKAVTIAKEDTNRAVTHNKGIFNGIDAVVMATGNDYRAVEANGHAFASKESKYRGLSDSRIEADHFVFELQIPLAIGTVGGLTKSHPLAAFALEILGNPDAAELMKIIAAVGLANNFSAVRSLISSGIQEGHMKLHLSNILNQLGVDTIEEKRIREHFEGKIVSYSAAKTFLNSIRNSTNGGAL